MKRLHLIGMTLALGLGLICARGAQGQTKLAIVNVGEVFQKYDKAKFYKDELEKIISPKKVEAETLKKQMIDWKKATEAPGFDKSKKDVYDKAIVDNQRKLEDLSRTMSAQISKLQEGQIVSLYKDLNAAIEAVAKANGIHMVLAYGEVTEDPLNVFNINRKMNGMDLGSTTPLFFTNDVNLTPLVIQTLNHSYRPTTPATPTGRPGM